MNPSQNSPQGGSAINADAAARLAAQTVSDPSLTVSALVPTSSLSQPTSMAFLAPDDILVLEKANGQVRRIPYPYARAACPK